MQLVVFVQILKHFVIIKYITVICKGQLLECIFIQ